MIVLDASVVIELLLNNDRAATIQQSLRETHHTLIAPHLLDVEVLSALRRLQAKGVLDEHDGRMGLRALLSLPIERYPHQPLLERIWELRRNFTSYDAAYIALAEAMEARLYTCDEKLLRGHGARVELF